MELELEEQPQAQSLTATTRPSEASNKKRALLIGIEKEPAKTVASPKQKPTETKKKADRKTQLASNGLRGCHTDVNEMKQILIGVFSILLSLGWVC